MVSDIILALWNTVSAIVQYTILYQCTVYNTVPTCGYAVGKNLIHYGLLNFAYYPVIAYHTTFMMIAIDKVIAIAFPFKHKQIMTCYVVVGMI